MTNIEYPVPCLLCQKSLYGPVNFCPFCGKSLKESAKRIEPESEPIKTFNIPKTAPGPVINELNLKFDEQKELVSGTFSAVSSDGFSIKNAEWWIGSDPGAGNGEALEVVDGSSEKPIAEFSISIDVSEYQEGGCRINIRSQDDRDEWGKTEAWNFTVKKTAKIKESTQESLEAEDKKTTTPRALKPKPWKWIALAAMMVMLIGAVGYFYYRSDVPPEPPWPPPTPNCKLERALVLEALNQGVQLSVLINTISKQENLVKAAKKLTDISEKYAPQLADAESKLRESFVNKNTMLATYSKKLLQLSREQQEQIFCAMDLVNKEKLSSREKLVIELLTKHLNLLNKGSEPDQNILSSDFIQNFNNFKD